MERFVRLRPAVLARMAASTPAELRAEFESVTGRQLQALAVLPEAGLTMSDLAASLGVSGAAASVLSDRLVAQGLAVRGADPADRRVVRLAPTSRGTALAARYQEAQRLAVAALLESLTDEQVIAWLDIMETLAVGGEQPGHEGRGGQPGREGGGGQSAPRGRSRQTGPAAAAELAEAGR